MEESVDSAATEALLPSSTSAVPSPKLPYICYVLSSKTIPRTLPPGLDDPTFPIENWHAFWSGIKPIMQSVELRDSLMCGIAVMIVLKQFASHSMAVFLRNIWFSRDVALFISYSSDMVPYFGFVYFFLRLRKSQLESLRRLCRDEEALFRRYGFTVECTYQSYKLNWRWSSGFCLYFIPVPIGLDGGQEETVELPVSDARSCDQHGYIRIKTFHSSGYSWNAINIPYLETYHTLPAGFETLCEGLWGRFWTDMILVSKQILFAFRILVTASVFALFLSFLLTLSCVAIWSGADYFFYAMNASMICVIFVLGRVIQLTHRRHQLVQQYLEDFARYNVHMEYRRIYEFTGWTGFIETQYLYMFPPPAIARLRV